MKKLLLPVALLAALVSMAQLNLVSVNQITGTLGPTKGGTGNAVYAIGDILSADTTTTLSRVAAVAAGRIFRAAGANTLPAWSTMTYPDTLAAGAVLGATGANAAGAIDCSAAGVVLQGGTPATCTTNPVTTTMNGGGTATTAAGVFTRGSKIVSGLADNTATTVLTWSAPNAQVTAMIKIYIMGALGAGGAIGAGECSRAQEFRITITRTAGVNAVSAASSLLDDTGSNAVAGGTSCTVARSLVAVSGAVGAVNTQAIQIAVARGTGSSTNHTVTVTYEITNFTANGVTVS